MPSARAAHRNCGCGAGHSLDALVTAAYAVSGAGAVSWEFRGCHWHQRVGRVVRMFASARGPLLVASLAAGLLGLAAGVGEPAYAHPPITPTMQAHAQEKMLVVADLPAGLKVDPGWEFTTKIDRHDLKFELCTVNGKAIEAPPAPVMYQVEFGETDLLNDPHSLQENVWQFASTSAAEEAWRVLKERARQCTGTTNEAETSQATPIRQVLSNGVARQLVQGVPGVWTHSTYLRPSVGADAGEGGYYVAYLVGSAILTVEYDFQEGVNLSPLRRRVVNTVTRQLAERWLADPAVTYP